jgi:hypothetical protein
MYKGEITMSLDLNMAKIAHFEYEMRIQEHRTLRTIARIRREKRGPHPVSLVYHQIVNWLQSSLKFATAQQPATPITNPQTPCLDC